MPYPSRTSLKIVAVVFGIFVAVAPIILFNAWLKKQGDDETAMTAGRALGSTEIRVGQSIAALQDLSARGVDSCKPAHVEAMRQAALLTEPIKQVMLMAPNGDTLCTDTSGLAARLEVLTSVATAMPDIVLDVARLPARGERFLRVRKIGQPDKPALAALVLASCWRTRAEESSRLWASSTTSSNGRAAASRTQSSNRPW